MTVNISIALLDELHMLALEAGRAIMEIYNTDFEVDTKADSSPVTQADKIAEAIITRALMKDIKTPFPIVGEEAFADGHAPHVGDGPFWLVDPLDGTKEFISKNGEFTVNIALIDAGRPALGVVHAPALGHTYMGSPHGAAADLDGHGPKPIQCRHLPRIGVTALVSRHHKGTEVDAILKDYNVSHEISAGSSLKFCLLAEGKADLYPRLGRTMEWDTAAGHAVLKAAGGTVQDLEGRELTYAKAGFENPHFIAHGKPAL